MIYSKNMEYLGSHDLNGIPALKMGMQEVDGRFFLYAAPWLASGWHILDVTEPSKPKHLRWIPGPGGNTQTWQVQVADGLMITGLTARSDWGAGADSTTSWLPDAEVDEGVIIWDVSEPDNPKKLGHWRTGARGYSFGTHRSYYDGGRYVHVSTCMPGFDREIYVILDISDPTDPKPVGRWWWPGQNVAAGEKYSESDAAKFSTGNPLPGAYGAIWLHGAPYAAGNRVYASWIRAGMVILDISDVAQPKKVSSLSFYPPMGGAMGLHSAVPIPHRGIAIVNSEACFERGAEPLNFIGVVDIRQEKDPMLAALFPQPEVPEGYPVADFHLRNTRSGPHNQHQYQNNPALLNDDEYIYMAHFGAGVQVFDIRNPRRPTIAGYCIPPDPTVRRNPRPTDLLTLIDDLIVDRRGNIFAMDRNSGLHVMRFNRPEKPTTPRLELDDFYPPLKLPYEGLPGPGDYVPGKK